MAERRPYPMTAVEHFLGQVAWELLPPQNAPDDLPYATHSGILTLPGVGDMRVYQLNTGMRVLDADDVQRLFGGEAGHEEEKPWKSWS